MLEISVRSAEIAAFVGFFAAIGWSLGSWLVSRLFGVFDRPW